MKLNEDSGKIISNKESKKITDKHKESRKFVEENGETYIESYFLGKNKIVELLKNTAINDVLGVRINCGVDEDGEKTIVVEPVMKNKTEHATVLGSPPICPKICGT